MAVDLQTQTNTCVVSLERYVESSKRKLVVHTLADGRTCTNALPSSLTGVREGFDHTDLSVESQSHMFPWLLLISVLIPFFATTTTTTMKLGHN